MSKPGNQNGVAYDLPFSEYLASPGVSNSRLRKIHKSPYHYAMASVFQEEEKPEMVIGSMVHAAFLEGDRSGFEVVDSLKSNAAAAARQAGRTPVTQQTANYADAMCNALATHPLVSTLLAKTPHREVSVWHRDEATGIIERARLDAPSTMGILGDLKTTADASPDGFARSAGRYGYHDQAEAYLRLANATLAHEDGYEPFDEYWLVVIESSPPFAIGVYQMGPRSLETARIRNRRALERLAECERTNYWPSYTGVDPDDIQTIEIPNYLQETA